MLVFVPSFRQRFCSGFSLIELMVAMVLGILLLLAVSELFVNNSRTRSEIERTSRQIENGQYAIQLLTDELSNAGFFGEVGGAAFPPLPLPGACVTAADDVKATMGVPVFGENNLASGAPACLPDYKTAASATVANDYVAIRRASTCAAGTTGCDAFENGAYHIQVSACQTDNPGQLLLGQTPGELAAMTRACDEDQTAARYLLLSRLYYINADDQLVRAELGVQAGVPAYEVTPLVDGIERLQFEFGIDTSGDGSPEAFKSAPAAAEWEDVVVVRAWVLARNLETTPNYADTNTYRLGDLSPVVAPGDGFKRQVYSTTVRINNVAGRRE